MSFRKFREMAKRAFLNADPRWVLPVHAQWYSLRAIEPEIRWLPWLCDPQALSIDVGAHEGIYAWHMMRHSRAVIAFEPNPHCAERLRRALGSKAQVREVAASDGVGAAELVVPVDDGAARTALASIDTANPSARRSESRQVHRVPRSTLDAELRDSGTIGLIKIDVEGHELAVLRGATELCRKQQPHLVVEAENRHRADAVESIREHLAGLGYEGFYLSAGQLHPIENFKPERDQNPHREDLSQPYINNFLFVAREPLLERLKRQARGVQ